MKGWAPTVILTLIGLSLAGVLFFTIGSNSTGRGEECAKRMQSTYIYCDNSVEHGFPMVYKVSGDIRPVGLIIDIASWVIAAHITTLGVYALIPEKK